MALKRKLSNIQERWGSNKDPWDFFNVFKREHLMWVLGLRLNTSHTFMYVMRKTEPDLWMELLTPDRAHSVHLYYCLRVVLNMWIKTELGVWGLIKM